MMWPYLVAALALAQQSPLAEQPFAADSGIDPTLFVGPPLEVDLAPPAPAPADLELVVAECAALSSPPGQDAGADAFDADGVRDLLAALHERLPAETAKAQQLLAAENDEITSAAAPAP